MGTACWTRTATLPDWIELLNVSSDVVDLDGWHLTDDAQDRDKWQLPRVSCDPGQHLVVFASGKDRDNPTRPLHTDFKLERDGEYLALTRPDESVEFEFAPQYPPAGRGCLVRGSECVDASAAGRQRFRRPASGCRPMAAWIRTRCREDLTGTWLDPALDTSGPEWFDADLGIGFYDPADDPNPQPGAGTLIADSVAEFSQFQNRDGWRYGYWNIARRTADGEYDASSGDFKPFSWSGLTTISAINQWDGTQVGFGGGAGTATDGIARRRRTSRRPQHGAEVHVPIRRWTSEVSGSVLIYGRLENPLGG